LLSTLRFETLQENHIAPILGIESQTNSAPWSERSFRNELDHKHGIFLTAIMGGEVVGYGGIWLVIDEAHVTTIAVVPAHQRQGIARQLMTELLVRARKAGMKCSTLEARAGNEAAISLYEKLGFSITGRRKGYYPDNKEDAVVMWLHDLAEEFAAGEKHDSLPPVFALNRIWITSHNRAVVLDFPCPGFPADTSSNDQSIDTSSGESGGVSFSQFQGFLQSVVRHMLDGQSGHTNPPPPLYAQSFLQSLAGARFESAEILVGNLRSLLGRTAEVTRRRRWATLGVAFSPAIILALALAATLWFENRRINRTWPTEFGDSAELRAELLAFQTFGDHPAVETVGLKTDPGEDALKRFRRMFRVHIASHHRELIEAAERMRKSKADRPVPMATAAS